MRGRIVPPIFSSSRIIDRKIKRDVPTRTNKDSVPPRIAVTGFMAAGKTTVARELARRLSCTFLDLDELIKVHVGRTPQELIDEEGEARFRDIETRVLRDALTSSDAFILALGGGAWTLERNRALLKKHRCLTVWLDASFELCWERISKAGAEARPLARERESAQRLYEERRASYGLAALRVEVSDADDAARIAAKIAVAIAL